MDIFPTCLLVPLSDLGAPLLYQYPLSQSQPNFPGAFCAELAYTDSNRQESMEIPVRTEAPFRSVFLKDMRTTKTREIRCT